jgi:hypothetical protein
MPLNSANRSEALTRFEASMAIDFDKWHDGIGYDLSCLPEMSEAERSSIAATLASKHPLDWRDVEALASIGTEYAMQRLSQAANSNDPNIIRAISEFAPELISERAKTEALIQALRTLELYGGLSQAIDDAAEFHPPPVVEALFEGALKREGEAAVHFAALLFYLHGKADTPFDWEHRPLFLAFAANDAGSRLTAFEELCRHMEVDASRWVRGPNASEQ